MAVVTLFPSYRRSTSYLDLQTLGHKMAVRQPSTLLLRAWFYHPQWLYLASFISYLRFPHRQFRICSHQLQIESHHCIAEEERICQLCHLQKLVSEDHFIFREYFISRSPSIMRYQGNINACSRIWGSFSAFSSVTLTRSVWIFTCVRRWFILETLQVSSRPHPAKPTKPITSFVEHTWSVTRMGEAQRLLFKPHLSDWTLNPLRTKHNNTRMSNKKADTNLY